MVTKMEEREIKALDSSDIRERLKDQKANRDYFRSNYQDLLGKYKNHWVVISGGKLLRVESNPDHLFDNLNQIKRKDSLVYYLADPEDVMIL